MTYTRRQFLKLTVISAALPALLSACGRASGVNTMASPTQQAERPAFGSGVYRNLFAERGKSEAEIAAKIDAAWQSLFASNDDKRRVYYPAGENEHGPLAYVKDIGNDDIRSEGMSYG
ncbi:MAG: glycoside hydrolase, partial [Chloroflexi bacterium]|nr:glycoside hydrolase [Chloroflexota bacterium]